MRAKPSIFVGSSGERKNVADMAVKVLADVADGISWNLASFIPGKATLESLALAAEEYDFGLFIFGPDDKTSSRGKLQSSTRDNVLFEYGLFLGAQGTERTFGIVEDGDKKTRVKIPSDLAGIEMPRFSQRTDTELLSSLQRALHPIAQQIRREGRWHRRYGLRRSYGIKDKGTFFVRLSGSKIKQRRNKLIAGNLCLIIHKEDETRPFERINRLSIGDLQAISRLQDDRDLVLELPVSSLKQQIDSNDLLCGHLLFIPEKVMLKGCNTIESMLDEGAELLDSFALKGAEHSDG